MIFFLNGISPNVLAAEVLISIRTEALAQEVKPVAPIWTIVVLGN
jgi:hypothetical protein